MANVHLFGTPLWRLLHALPSVWQRALAPVDARLPEGDDDEENGSSDGRTEAIHDAIVTVIFFLLWLMPCGLCLISLRSFYPETLAACGYADIEGVLAAGPEALRTFLYALHDRVNLKLMTQRIEASDALAAELKPAVVAAAATLCTHVKPDVHAKWFRVTDGSPLSDADAWVLAEAIAMQTPCIESAHLAGGWLAALALLLDAMAAAWSREASSGSGGLRETARRLRRCSAHFLALCDAALNRDDWSAFPDDAPRYDDTACTPDDLWARRRQQAAALAAKPRCRVRVAAEGAHEAQVRLGNFLLALVVAARHDAPLADNEAGALAVLADDAALRAARARAELLRAGTCIDSCT